MFENFLRVAVAAHLHSGDAAAECRYDSAFVFSRINTKISTDARANVPQSPIVSVLAPC